MSLPAFIHPGLDGISVGDSLMLHGAEGRHAVTVKRIVAGERILLIGSAGTFCEATVQDVRGKDELIAIVDEVGVSHTPDPRVVIVQAIPKSERSELAIDLATQAGADEFIAWQADRCIAKWDGKKAPKALGKWQAQAESSAKQSRRTRIPTVHGPLTTRQLVQHLKSQDTKPLVYVLHEDATDSIKDVELEGDVLLIIGPEGGIGEEELSLLQEAGAHAIKLGPEVLRTASAGMVALAAIGVRTARW